MKKIFVILLFVSVVANAQWVLQNSGVSSYLYSVHFVNDNTGFVAGAGGLVLKTTDGGNLWTTMSSELQVTLNAIRFADNNSGWTVGTNGTIFKTTNGGVNWETQLSGTSRILRSVFCNDPNTAWISGDSIILKTTDGGSNWFKQSASVTKRFYSVYFINADTGWITGYSTLKTTNGGTNWVTKVAMTNRRSICFPDANTGWVSGGSYTINKSTDGGETWGAFGQSVFSELEGDSPPATYTCIYFINVNTGWYTSSHSFGGRIRMTTNGGSLWTTDYPTTWNRELYSLYALSPTTAWAVGRGGTILKRGNITGNSNNEQHYPHKYSLEQNYPNPFNPTTKIQFALSKSSFAKLVVYDALGREVATLVNEQLNEGTYEADWSATGGADKFSSGVYYYKLSATGGEGDYTETKKMVLMK